MSSRRFFLWASAAGLAISLVTALPAQRLDRNTPPVPGKAPELQVPKWTHTTLANGAELIVSEKHDLPLVTFSISFIGGSANYEPADKVGLASITAQMLNEGTTSRTGDQLSDAQQLLGTSIGAGISDEEGSVGFTALKDRFDPALTLLADMMLHPSFPAASLERIRAQRLVSLQQAKEQPQSIANDVFSKVLYGDDHPYGRITTEAGLKAITRDDIVAFHRDYFRPGRAIITVVGDVDGATVKTEVEKALAEWPAGGTRPSFSYPPPPAPGATTIYLVDKPKAAQSVFALGLPGPSRATPDYYAIEMMNTILGGLFQSRLNHDIREEKGYSYGVGSYFAYGKGPGAFEASGSIVTNKSDSALIEFMKQLKGAEGSVPFTDDEMSQGRAALIQSLPSRFSSVNATASSISSLYTEGLPTTYYQDFAKHIDAITKDEMVQAAKKYIDLNRLNIVIVGDKAAIEDPLRKTGIAPIVILDRDGKRVIIP
jgi:predicted Zn-dependent peptidase